MKPYALVREEEHGIKFEQNCKNNSLAISAECSQMSKRKLFKIILEAFNETCRALMRQRYMFSESNF